MDRIDYPHNNPMRVVDPDGRQGYDSLNPDEKALAKANPLVASRVGEARSEAYKATEEKFPGQPAHNNKADAFRHCVWSCTMAADSGIGPKKAEEFAEAHESGDAAQTPEEAAMDRNNNGVGLMIGGAVRDGPRNSDSLIRWIRPQ